VKIKEAAVLLKGQAVEAQGIYNSHFSTTPMELSDPDMAPVKRSNQMAPAKRSHQMAPTKRSNQTLLVERRNQKVSQTALTYGYQQRGSQAVTDTHKTEMVFIFGTWA